MGLREGEGGVIEREEKHKIDLTTGRDIGYRGTLSGIPYQKEKSN